MTDDRAPVAILRPALEALLGAPRSTEGSEARPSWFARLLGTDDEPPFSPLGELLWAPLEASDDDEYEHCADYGDGVISFTQTRPLVDDQGNVALLTTAEPYATAVLTLDDLLGPVGVGLSAAAALFAAGSRGEAILRSRAASSGVSLIDGEGGLTLKP
ncbi:MAG: hypothetical protein GY898_03570 [Proteobacteria bacterium]|nr:hypothetical protein [Pseudomonadota bacterium]